MLHLTAGVFPAPNAPRRAYLAGCAQPPAMPPNARQFGNIRCNLPAFIRPQRAFRPGLRTHCPTIHGKCLPRPPKPGLQGNSVAAATYSCRAGPYIHLNPAKARTAPGVSPPYHRRDHSCDAGICRDTDERRGSRIGTRQWIVWQAWQERQGFCGPYLRRAPPRPRYRPRKTNPEG